MKPGMLGLSLALGLSAAPALAQETIKIGVIDPLSGGGASVGEGGLKTVNYLADEINAAGGANGKKLEIVAFDNKGNPQETLIQAQKAADLGIRIVVQANGSSNGIALSDWVTKFNQRNPGKEIVYVNYGAIDPVMTNDKCSYWHFRMDSSVDMRMAALTTFMMDRPNIKKVYLINQDYSFGQSVRDQSVKMLGQKRPDIQIVGNELVPLLKITDFSPYIAKIKASGADAVITGNWGQDLALLLKSAADAGLQADWFTYYASLVGSPTAVKQTGLAHRVFVVGEGFANSAPEAAQTFETAFRAKEGMGLWYPKAVNMMHTLAKAIDLVKADDAKSVAAQLEGIKIEAFDGGDSWIRKDDHQYFANLYIASFGPLDTGAKFDEEGTGWGWKTVGVVKAVDTVLPTSCKMERP